MKQNGVRGTVARVQQLTPNTGILFVFILLLQSAANAFPVQSTNDTLTLEDNSTTIDDLDLLHAIQAMSTIEPTHFHAPITLIKPQLISMGEWKQMISNNGPLITKAAFDIGPSFSPTHAFITSGSYRKYAKELVEKCWTTKGENIAETPLNTLNNDYFRWEERQFNKALLNKLFPETSQGDYNRFLSTTNTNNMNRIRLSNDLENRCRFVEHKDDWTYKIDEKTQFEDYLINRIFQPKILGAYAQAIIDEIEADDDRQLGANSGNSTMPNATMSRRKRSDPNASRWETDRTARLKYAEQKAKKWI